METICQHGSGLSKRETRQDPGIPALKPDQISWTLADRPILISPDGVSQFRVGGDSPVIANAEVADTPRPLIERIGDYASFPSVIAANLVLE
jgi:hypothetical protein